MSIQHSLRHTIRNVLAEAATRLVRAGSASPHLDAELLLAHVLQKDRVWLYLNHLSPLQQDRLEDFYALLRRREQREPVAYIIGSREFFALEFQVNSHVLIPRPETELLVEMVLQMTHDSESTIADIGTGTGCIIIALAKNLTGCQFWATDISPVALDLARQNAVQHRVEQKIDFYQGDLLQPLAGSFDFIVSNPPYLSLAELAVAPPEVGKYEPALALEGGQDGLQLIRRLLRQASEKLTPTGCLLIEIGATQGHAGITLAREHFPTATIFIKRDLAGLDRILVIKLDR